MQESHSIYKKPFHEVFLQDYGGSLLNWGILSIIPLILFLLVLFKAKSRSGIIGANITISILWCITLLGFHFMMSFGEAFVEGIDDKRFATWGVLTVITIIIFSYLNSRKKPLQNKAAHTNPLPAPSRSLNENYEP